MNLPFDVNKADRYIADADGRMAEIIARYGPCAMAVRAVDDLFESLFRSIVFQQLSTKAATSIYGRVKDLFEAGIPTPAATLALPDEAMRGAGMSRAKVTSTKDLAAKSIAGTVPTLQEALALSDAEIIERLTEVWGIGRWTVEMLLMFSLGRPDVLPSTDLAIRKGFQQVYGHEELPQPKAIDVYGECWRPYRTIASWYLWRVIDGDNEAW